MKKSHIPDPIYIHIFFYLALGLFITSQIHKQISFYRLVTNGVHGERVILEGSMSSLNSIVGDNLNTSDEDVVVHGIIFNEDLKILHVVPLDQKKELFSLIQLTFYPFFFSEIGTTAFIFLGILPPSIIGFLYPSDHLKLPYLMFLATGFMVVASVPVSLINGSGIRYLE